MIFGVHFLLYSSDPEADRAFLRDVLGLSSVDAGGGWLIFALPPSEIAVHPGDGPQHAEEGVAGAALYLMCDDLQATVRTLAAKNVACSNVEEAGWGVRTTFRMPSGAEVGLYQPRHPIALRRG